MTLIIRRNKWGMSICERYFPSASDSVFVGDCSLQVDFCAGQPAKHHRLTRTLLIDLQQSLATIFSAFRKSYRRDIRKVSSRLQACFIRQPSVAQLTEFAEALDKLAQYRGFQGSNPGKMLAFAEQDALLFSEVRDLDSGIVLCRHLYILVGKRLRLLHSVSSYVQSGQGSARPIAEANRFLHWQDICWAKQSGFECLDLGGLALNGSPAMAGINHFKVGFGGEVREEYINVQPRNPLAWLAMQYWLRQWR